MEEKTLTKKLNKLLPNGYIILLPSENNPLRIDLWDLKSFNPNNNLIIKNWYDMVYSGLSKMGAI